MLDFDFDLFAFDDLDLSFDILELTAFEIDLQSYEWPDLSFGFDLPKKSTIVNFNQAQKKL